jgi:outer membrane protein assembly factor BamB
MHYRSAIAISLLCCGLAACGPSSRALLVWRQVRADASNTGMLIVGTKPARMEGALTGGVPPIAHSSPVVAPDGHVYVTTWGPEKSGASDIGHGAVMQIAATGAPLITGTSGDMPGQLSTPAVDEAGNIYVAQYLTFNHGAPQSALLRWDSKLGNVQSVRIGGVALSAPKILDGTGRAPLIVQTYTTDIGAHHVLILSSQLKPLADWETCVPDQPSIWDNFRIGFHVGGIDLGPPYNESASVGIRAIEGERDKTHYLVAAGDGCGVTFYKIDPTLTNPKVLTFIEHHGSSAALLTSPAISADGIAVIADSDHHITAYDVTTGDQKWQTTTNGFIAAAPTMTPGAINVVYAATYSEIVKLDLATGTVLKSSSLTGVFTDASPAAAGNLIFVSTSAGLFSFNQSDLSLAAAAPFAAGESSPAIGPNGYVIVPSTDGKMFRFPGL